MKADNFFIYIPLKQQIVSFLHENWEAIEKDRQKEQIEVALSDVSDGMTIRTINAKYPDSVNLCLMICLDGAKVYQNNKSIWPMQIILNFLPRNIRYTTSRILTTGLYYGRGKPDLKNYCMPLIHELRQLCNSFKISEISDRLEFRVFLTQSLCDLPAKAMCQGLTQYNGKFACSYCLHPGVSIPHIGRKGSTIRYTSESEPSALRTHEKSLSSLAKLKHSKGPMEGFKSVSFFIGVPHFNLISGFPIDYMHCVLLNVVPKLVGLWLDSRNFREPFYIKNKKALNERVISITPPTSTIRPVRSFDERENFKANEWRAALLYYLYHACEGLIDNKYRTHWMMLSSSIYSLSKTEISKVELELIKKK